MKRAKMFFIVDAVAFVLFALLTSTGVLVRYTLPAGSGHFKTLWGMDRHDWGQIHFWMAVALLVALVVHVFFHWKWVVSMVKGRPRQGSGVRLGLALVALLALIGLLALPFLAPVEQSGEPPHKQHTSSVEGEGELGVDIDGSMTLHDIEQQTGVPVATILEELDLPEDVSPNEKLGRLRRLHGFELSDVREVIRQHEHP